MALERAGNQALVGSQEPAGTQVPVQRQEPAGSRIPVGSQELLGSQVPLSSFELNAALVSPSGVQTTEQPARTSLKRKRSQPQSEPHTVNTFTPTDWLGTAMRLTSSLVWLCWPLCHNPAAAVEHSAMCKFGSVAIRKSNKVGCIAGKGDRLLSDAAAAGDDMGGTSAKRLCCESAAHADPPELIQMSAPASPMAHPCKTVHGVAMPETPTNACNRYAFLAACYSNLSVSRLKYALAL